VFRRTLAFVALSAVLAAGCDARQEPSESGWPTLHGGADLRLPLDAYQLAPHQWKQVSRAHRVLVAMCMRRFGITSPEPVDVSNTPRTANERRYGITDAALAAVAGYGLSADGPSTRPTRVTSGSADPTTLAVLAGDGEPVVRGQLVPAGGCYGEARRRLNTAAPHVPDIFLAGRLARESLAESERDIRVSTVLREWSACMRTRGFDYSSPPKAAADPRFAGPPSALEVNTATADIACKRQTNVVGVWFTVEAQLQRQTVSTNRPALDEIREMNEAQLKVAHSLGID
jgi:hypothetical protein